MHIRFIVYIISFLIIAPREIWSPTTKRQVLGSKNVVNRPQIMPPQFQEIV